MNCIVKTSHEDGTELMHPRTWCGGWIQGEEFHFEDPNHAAAACEYGSLNQPCQACKEALVAALSGGQKQINQCDGCTRSLPLVRGIHKDGKHLGMACTKANYKSK